jgi:hypothetical protein
MKRTYETRPRSDELGGGWKLTLLEDGEELGSPCRKRTNAAKCGK